MALELIALLMARGVHVPDGVRVVGFDNRAAASYFDPPIPTSAPDFERMGDVACGLLIEAIETGSAAPRTVLLDVPLLIRKRYAVAPPANGRGARIVGTAFVKEEEHET
jgi:LacI family transcriptional regulator